MTETQVTSQIMENEIKNLREVTVWYGTYKDIAFEIRKSKSTMPEFEYSWSYYLYIILNRLPKSALYQLVISKYGAEYYKHPIYPMVWFHGGITHAHIEKWNESESHVIGCDYQHANDTRTSYNEDYILFDVKQSINSFLELVPNYNKVSEPIENTEQTLG